MKNNKSSLLVQLIPRFTTGGAEKLVLLYAEEAKRQNMNVLVASMRDGGELEEVFYQQGIQLQIGEPGLLGYIRGLRNLHTTMREHKNVILHTHVFSADLAGFVLSKLNRNVVWLSTQHNTAAECTWLRLKILRKILPLAKNVIAVSQKVLDTCNNDFKLSSEKIVRIDNGIELVTWLNVEKLSQLSHPLQLATIGRLDKQKGHVVLFQALSTFKDVPWRLHIYGEGDIENALAIKAESLGISDKLCWHGVVSDIPAALAKIDIVVQPSLWEGRSLVMMESMAAGRIVVASEPAAQGLIDEIKNGYVVPAGDFSALTYTLEHIASHADEALERATAARKFAQTNFSTKGALQKLFNIYINY